MSTVAPTTNVAKPLMIEEYPAPAIVKQQALLQDWAAESAKFQADPDKFWENIAKQFVWTKPWTKV
ncbi:MAG TPA: acetate--CoA ligase, partial [Candidatus Angelobacter sp.]|nr:acetate--CoA ligase [Candidatus Angelobacter sp.]